MPTGYIKVDAVISSVRLLASISIVKQSLLGGYTVSSVGAWSLNDVINYLWFYFVLYSFAYPTILLLLLKFYSDQHYRQYIIIASNSMASDLSYTHEHLPFPNEYVNMNRLDAYNTY